MQSHGMQLASLEPLCSFLLSSFWGAGLFLDLCILAGCDYLPSMPGFGLKTAHKALRTHGSALLAVRLRKMEVTLPTGRLRVGGRWVQGWVEGRCEKVM